MTNFLNEIKPEVVDFASSQNNVDGMEGLRREQFCSWGDSFISRDPSPQNQAGLDIMLYIFKLVEISGGWAECLGHGNKTRFLKKVHERVFGNNGNNGPFKNR